MKKIMLIAIMIIIKASNSYAQQSIVEIPEGVVGIKIGDSLQSFTDSISEMKLKRSRPISSEEILCGYGHYYIVIDKNTKINLKFANFQLVEIAYIKLLKKDFDLKTLVEMFQNRYGKPSIEDVHTDMARLVYQEFDSTIVEKFIVFISYGQSGSLSPPLYGIDPTETYYYCIEIKGKNLTELEKLSEQCIKNEHVKNSKIIEIPE